MEKVTQPMTARATLADHMKETDTEIDIVPGNELMWKIEKQEKYERHMVRKKSDKRKVDKINMKK